MLNSLIQLMTPSQNVTFTMMYIGWMESHKMPTPIVTLVEMANIVLYGQDTMTKKDEVKEISSPIKVPVEAFKWVGIPKPQEEIKEPPKIEEPIKEPTSDDLIKSLTPKQYDLYKSNLFLIESVTSIKLGENELIELAKRALNS